MTQPFIPQSSKYPWPGSETWINTKRAETHPDDAEFVVVEVSRWGDLSVRYLKSGMRSKIRVGGSARMLHARGYRPKKPPEGL